MEPSDEQLREFQHWKDDGLAERGFARWDELREKAPRLFKSEAVKPGDPNAKWWYLLTYDDVRDAYMNPDPYSSGQWQAVQDMAHKLIPVGLDPPEHGKYRRLLNAPFAPKEIKKLEGEIRDYCISLIDAFIDRGECDFRNEFAVRFPTAIFVKMIGLPLEKLDHYVELVHGWHQISPDDDMDGTKVAAGEAAVIGVLAELMQQRRAKPENDLMSYLIKAEVDGAPMSDEDLLATAMILLSAGLDTVVAQLGHMFAHLAQHPDLRRRVINEPESIPKIIEEMMRYYGIAVSARTLTRDIEIGGCPMRAGDRILMPIAAANRDPNMFIDADRFDPDRRGNNRHLSFGTGVHSCLGLHLARLEMRIALEEWHRRIPDYHVKAGTKAKLMLTDLLVTVGHLELAWDKFSA
ncbi:Cytochrome P450 [Sphingobium faniae]|nr:Cytochrome P450 [Sphingobium faniae]